MRVISGKFKGKKILEPKDTKTRPLKDLTKESIFNILAHSNKIKINLENSNILDLFSGVGSFGIECLSRGALNVTFVENYNKVLPILKKNLENLKSNENYKILTQDINIGLNFNNDKGLSGGISYDAITGEPRFDIGFRRTFADGGLASMFTRRG